MYRVLPICIFISTIHGILVRGKVRAHWHLRLRHRLVMDVIHGTAPKTRLSRKGKSVRDGAAVKGK